MTNVQERSRTRRQRVLDAALEVFAQHGYGDTAVDEIARVSDTSKGGLYFHFPSKQALFLALLDEASVALLRRVEVAMAAESDPLQRGDAALREVLHVCSSSKRSEPGKNSTRSSITCTRHSPRSLPSASMLLSPRVKFPHLTHGW